MHQASDPTRIGQVTVYITWLWLISELVSGAASVFTIYVLGGFGGPIAQQDQLELADSWVQWTAALTLLLFVAAAIVIARWIYVTNRNAHSFSDQVAIGPGWAVGWFFIPIASLYKPFQGVSATWRATIAPNDIDGVDVPALLRVWWGLWLATCALGNIDFRWSIAARTPEDIIASHWITCSTLLIDVPLAYVLTSIVKRLSAMQRDVLSGSAIPISVHDASV